MTFYQIIKSGKKLTVDTAGTPYTPTTFYLKDGKIIFSNKEIGEAEHPTFTARTFNAHIEQMLAEGFNIVTA